MLFKCLTDVGSIGGMASDSGKSASECVDLAHIFLITDTLPSPNATSCVSQPKLSISGTGVSRLEIKFLLWDPMLIRSFLSCVVIILSVRRVVRLLQGCGERYPHMDASRRVPAFEHRRLS